MAAVSRDAVAALGACVADVLGAPPETVPPFEGPEPLARLSEWLTGRRIGLVRARDPERFGWPARWIAIREPWRPVVMFGSPPGLLLDPLAGRHGDAHGRILEALVLAPLDVRVPELGPLPDGGIVEALVIAPAAGAPVREVRSVLARPGGLDGDRYAAGRGTFSGNGRTGQDLTLIEAEAIEELGRGGPALLPTDARRNVVTRGIELDALIGRRFRIGGVECYGQRRAEPCLHLESLTAPGVLRGLVHRAGIRADILCEGVLSVGDAVVPLA